jgi:3-deoxy-D-manno-octulosonic-acid transferase
MWLLYYTFVYAFVLGIRISSWWNKKSKQWLAGRKDWKSTVANLSNKSRPRIWFHVSSLGEFEQAKPVIEKIKSTHADIDIILTFFSPSGFLARSAYPHANVLYLPADLPGVAFNWIRLIQPDMGVFVKYDLWPGYLRAMHELHLPCILISANWQRDQSFGSWTVPLNKTYLKNFKRIFFQRNSGLDFFKSRGFHNLEHAGDTRIDRSLQLPLEMNDRIPTFLSQCRFDLVAGSTWEKDEEIIIPAIRELGLRTIIAPHDTSKNNIDRLRQKLDLPHSLLSQLNESMNIENILIVDSIGLLSVLYGLGDIAYVGGGFGKGIHNTLEPMAHGVPVIFGPGYLNFPEAVDMVSARSGWSIPNKEELIRILQHLGDKGRRDEAGAKNLKYLHDNAGATEKVTKFILESIPYQS